MSSRKYHDVTLAANDAAAYTPWKRLYREHILIAILLKISQNDLNIMRIRKIQNKLFFIKITLRALFAWHDSSYGTEHS